MSKIIRLESEIVRTPRVMQLEGLFDIDSQTRSITEIQSNIPDLSTRDWNVGLIVGPSGSGKTTVAKDMFGEHLLKNESVQWSSDHAVIDDFPTDMSMREVTGLLSSVGFSSPPSWLRPFHALSNGEKFRVSIARTLAEQKDFAVVDEFTSVIDRTVAQIGSHAIAKAVRKRGQKFVAVGCHYDVEDWLQPDWVYQPHLGEFTWRSVQPRPRVEIEIVWAQYSAWATFARHHYLDANLNKAASVYVGLVDGRPACLSAILPFPHPHIKNARRVSRTVVMPDFQGIGLGFQFVNKISAGLLAQGLTTTLTTSHPTRIWQLNKSSDWEIIRKPSRLARIGKTSDVTLNPTSSRSRLTCSFRYQGAPDYEIAKILAPTPQQRQLQGIR